MRDTATIHRQSSAASEVGRLVDIDGSAGHRHRLRLIAAKASARDLSDAVHALCSVHGEHPGMAAAALARAAQPEATEWLARVTDALAAERSYLAQLAAAAGPLPSTPGQAESEAALLAQRHALDMLARSDRRGCAAGAVAALAGDWAAVRQVLDQAARRFGVPMLPPALPSDDDTAASLAMLTVQPAAERAVTFGGQQLLAQHRALWDLLEARASARDG